MKQELITISREEYGHLKKSAHVDEELVKKIRRSLEDIKAGRMSEWKEAT